MPALQNVVLTDRAATPVAHTFTPMDFTSGVATLRVPKSVSLDEPKLTLSTRRTVDKVKVRMKLEIPTTVTEVVNGVAIPRVDRVAYAEILFTIPRNSTEQERKDLVGMFQSALDASKVLPNDVLVKLDGIY